MTRPNILFILLDNVGFGDPGCYGGGITRRAPTPRLDQLASEGLRLTNFNVEAECTPTRATLMTGRIPLRSGDVLVARRVRGVDGDAEDLAGPLR